MTMRLGALAALSLVILGGCTREPQEYLPPAEPPRIESFVASATSIKAGEQVTLTFATQNATETEILDQAGQKVAFDGDAAQGSATVTPEVTSFYVLRATGAGGRDSAFVRVDVAETLRGTALIAIPPSVRSGEEVQLIWTATNASNVSLLDGTGESLSVDASAGSGMVTVRPNVTTTYRLTATSPNVSQPFVSETTVTVAPVIAAFTAAPTAQQRGQPLRLAWNAGGSGTYSISEATFGPITNGTLAADGTGFFDWTIPETFPAPGNEPVLDGTPLRFTLTVHSTNPEVTLTAEARAKIGFGPEIARFDGPAYITRGDVFSLNWNVKGAVALRILRDGLSIYEPISGSAEILEGSLSFPAPTSAQSFELEVEDSDGNFSRKPWTVNIAEVPTVSLTGLPTNQVNANSRVNGTISSTDAVKVRFRFKDGALIDEKTTGLSSVVVGVTVGSTVKLVAEAENAAGRVVSDEKTVRVTPLTNGVAKIEPNPALSGETITATVDLTDLSRYPFSDLPGFPTTIVRTSADTTAPVAYDFVDLTAIPEAQVVQFSNLNDAITNLTKTSNFSFPLVGTEQREFWVSTNGFIAFNNVGALPNNLALDVANNAPSMIAPFWMDLAVPEPSTTNPAPKVLYMVDGNVFPRTLIVQWNDVSLSFTGARFTFQAQVSESGSVKFFYKTLVGDGYAGGQNATIGVKLSGGTFSAQHSAAGVATVAENSALQFLSARNEPSTFTFPATQSGQLRFYGTDTSVSPPTFAAFALPIRVFRAGDISIGEVMPNPDGAVGASGTWVELKNETSTTQDLSGLSIATSAMGSAFELPVGTELPPKGHLLLAAEAMNTLNGGLPTVDVTYGTVLTFNTGAERVSLLAGTAELAALAWTTGPQPGFSVTASEPVITSAGTPLNCPETSIYGPAQQTGSPRVANRSCFGYRLNPIPVSYNDIYPTGTLVWAAGVSFDSLIQTLDLSVAPVKLFGVQHSKVQLQSNGFIVPDTVSVTGSYAFSSPNPVMIPSAPTPNPAVVIFGDDLDDLEDNRHGPSVVLYKRIDAGQDPRNPAGHWVFQWHHVEQWNDYDDMNFQVKWFDDGVIEFHYDRMWSGSSANLADGNSATIWLENIAGDAALSVGSATSPPSISAHTAYRFTPTNL